MIQNRPEVAKKITFSAYNKLADPAVKSEVICN